jgi:hypothetical protein
MTPSVHPISGTLRPVPSFGRGVFACAHPPQKIANDQPDVRQAARSAAIPIAARLWDCGRIVACAPFVLVVIVCHVAISLLMPRPSVETMARGVDDGQKAGTSKNAY